MDPSLACLIAASSNAAGCRLDSKQLKQGVVSKRLAVPESITRPNYVRLQESPWGDDPQIHNSKVHLEDAPSLV